MKVRKYVSVLLAVAMIFTLIAVPSSAVSLPYTVIQAPAVNEVVPAEDNKIINGSFETAGGSLSMWGTECTVVTEPTIDGTRCVKMAPGGGNGVGMMGFMVDLLADEVYKMTVYAKQTGFTAETKGNLWIYFQGARTANPPSITFNAMTPGFFAGQWVKQSVYFSRVEQPNGPYAIQFLRQGDTTATIYVDNFSIVKVNKAAIPTPKPVPTPSVKTPVAVKIKTTSITKSTVKIIGTTSPKAHVRMVINKKIKASALANTKGAFTLKCSLKSYKKGQVIYFYAYNLKGSKELRSKTISVKMK